MNNILGDLVKKRDKQSFSPSYLNIDLNEHSSQSFYEIINNSVTGCKEHLMLLS